MVAESPRRIGSMDVAQFPERGPRLRLIRTRLANDQMVQDLDADDSPCLNQVPSGPDVGVRGSGISAWMRMGDHHGGGIAHDRRAKQLAWRDQHGIEGANAHQMKARGATTGVEMDGAKDFNVGVVPRCRGNIGHPVFVDPLGRVAASHRHWEFTQANDAEFVVVQTA